MALIAGSTIAWPLAARAQQPIPAIGWLSGTFPESEQDLPLPGFRQGLGEIGYVEGRMSRSNIAGRTV
jgi:putative ABC transport system substrate-binding protein